MVIRFWSGVEIGFWEHSYRWRLRKSFLIYGSSRFEMLSYKRPYHLIRLWSSITTWWPFGVLLCRYRETVSWSSNHKHKKYLPYPKTSKPQNLKSQTSNLKPLVWFFSKPVVWKRRAYTKLIPISEFSENKCSHCWKYSNLNFET